MRDGQRIPGDLHAGGLLQADERQDIGAPETVRRVQRQVLPEEFESAGVGGGGGGGAQVRRQTRRTGTCCPFHSQQETRLSSPTRPVRVRRYNRTEQLKIRRRHR